MSTRGFIKLLKRYRDGALPGRVREVMDVWYHTLHKEPAEQNSREEIRERIWSGISDKKQEATGHTLPGQPFRLQGHIFRRAAVALLVMGIIFYGVYNTRDTPALPPEIAALGKTGWVEVHNTESRERILVLHDGSTVTLGPGSTLWHPHRFERESRMVYLKGDGFFDVTKDQKRPFMVYSGAVLTRVLGTSFSIRSIAESGGTEVAVVTGKVMVEKSGLSGNKSREKEGGESRIVLTPNKKVIFFNNSNHYITGLVENPVIVANQEEFMKPGAFDFDETPLSEVLEKLEKAYGVEITLSNDSMLECPVTADLSSDNLRGKIEIIGAVLNARYEITGSTILLSGGGCRTKNHQP